MHMLKDLEIIKINCFVSNCINLSFLITAAILMRKSEELCDF